MRAIETVEIVQLPENVDGMLDGRIVTIKGEKGELTRDFSHAPVQIKLDGKEFTIQASWPRKREASMVKTVRSHIKNMIKGVTAGFTIKLKIVFSHFPLTVKVVGDHLTISNFTGERNPRTIQIMGSTKVQVKGEDIVIQGINLEHVSQTAANIQDGTKITNKDPRVFLDGIYIFEQHEGFVD
jgi:large subunit ribosomal protein L6